MLRFYFSLLICIVASTVQAESEGLYRVRIGGENCRINPDTGKQLIDSINVDSAALVIELGELFVEVGNFEHEDLAYGAMARIQQEGYSGAKIEYLSPEYLASQDQATKTFQSIDETSIVDRHMKLLGEGSSRSEMELWLEAENLIPDSTGEQWPHEVAKSVPILIEIKKRFPDSLRKNEATALLGRYYTTTGWRTKDKELKRERYYTARQQFLEILEESSKAEELEDAQIRLGHLNYGLRLLHPNKEKRITYLHEAHQAFTDYLSKYPEGKQSERAQLEAIGLFFEMAKIGEIGYEKALEESLKIEKNYPKASEYVSSRGKLIQAEILGRLDRREEAIKICDEILTNYSNEVRTSLCTAHQYKADCLFALGKYEKALSVYKEVLETYTEDDVMSSDIIDLDVMCNHFIGRCFLNLGQPDKAIAHFKKVIEIDPGSKWAPHTNQLLGELNQ